MAVDDWLCGTATAPVLRIYDWAGEWCSLGYFGSLAEAVERIDCPQWVRRITGGGVVDHRVDWTYSLVIPKSDPVANLRGGESYRAIHETLAATLCAEGVDCRLSSGAAVAGEALCFANPVDHDVVGAAGGKLAGAGQRRSATALLHQGSVALPAADEASRTRAHALANRLADGVAMVDLLPDAAWIDQQVRDRYARDDWTARR